ncbi:MAG: hypothetical protein N2Z21_00750 [Candidatus Sumerlaeaceae bacterium]|nr:hypothetical protein [Candidatus Sumerlaeaceae bacterium]
MIIPGQRVWRVLFLSWLIPGYGYYVNGLRRRGVVVFLAIQLTFLLGCALRGGVFLPEFRWSHEGFNIVSLLTFLTQIFNGGAALISLIPEVIGGRWAVLPYDESYCWADLGSFYILVSGGLNYFVLTSTYDHFYGKKRINRPQEEQGEEQS